MTLTLWLHWIAAFLIVVAVLTVGVWVQEWWEWRHTISKISRRRL